MVSEQKEICETVLQQTRVGRTASTITSQGGSYQHRRRRPAHPTPALISLLPFPLFPQKSFVLAVTYPYAQTRISIHRATRRGNGNGHNGVDDDDDHDSSKLDDSRRRLSYGRPFIIQVASSVPSTSWLFPCYFGFRLRLCLKAGRWDSGNCQPSATYYALALA